MKIEVSRTLVGIVGTKTRGREVGKKCVIIDIINKNFVLITGPKALSGVKRRRVNMKHIQLTDDFLKISRSASDQEIMKTLKETGRIKDMKIKVQLSELP